METEDGPVAALGEMLTQLPRLGPRVARRAATHIAQMTREQADRLADAIEKVGITATLCLTCRNISDRTTCQLCENERRDDAIICVVESPRDLIAIERAACFLGRYHVLHGRLSPVRGVTPEDIETGALLARVDRGVVKEVVMATNPSHEGDATAAYLSAAIRRIDEAIRITKLARGLPTGADVSYADQLTIRAALAHRRPI